MSSCHIPQTGLNAASERTTAVITQRKVAKTAMFTGMVNIAVRSGSPLPAGRGVGGEEPALSAAQLGAEALAQGGDDGRLGALHLGIGQRALRRLVGDGVSQALAPFGDARAGVHVEEAHIA